MINKKLDTLITLLSPAAHASMTFAESSTDVLQTKKETKKAKKIKEK
jgi:hypothetical protein